MVSAYFLKHFFNQ